MVTDLLIIGIGGFVGAVTRFFLFQVFDPMYHKYGFPFGTLVVNIIGSLLIGIALALSVKYQLFVKHTALHYFFVTGFLGALTTFSTFSQDSFQLLLNRNYIFFVANVIGNVVLCLSVTAIGYWIIQKLA
jgi:CrcB protein